MLDIQKISAKIILCCQMVFFFGCTNVPAPIDSHFNRGVEHYGNKELARAIEEYKLALRKNPKDTFALYNLAVVYQDQGKNDQAVEIYKTLSDLEIEKLKKTEGQNSFAQTL